MIIEITEQKHIDLMFNLVVMKKAIKETERGSGECASALNFYMRMYIDLLEHIDNNTKRRK